ncbi:hypothetical protein L210DRAFT_3565163 [Boletus edulis BED1]|uniref:Uncharacterized protein n=1 Tax=Boletus edulis BED1 TaxID=1328754 RepID=A0AAD4G8F2_BOLED|nr:hypothetical protein L210DRAFT_3565163 [Boletus edulis BED1]
MEYHHGRSMASMLDLNRDVKTWWHVVGESRFPKDSMWSEMWEKMKKERANTKCDCLSTSFPYVMQMWEEWFAMMIWLQPASDAHWKDPAFFIRASCDGCKTRAVHIHEQIYGSPARYTDYLPAGSVSISYILKWYREETVGVMEKNVSFARAVLTKILSPAVISKFDETWKSLEPGLDSGRLDWFAANDGCRYAPWVYQYPLDFHVQASFLACSIGPYSNSNIRPPEAEYLAALPHGLADDAPNLIVMLGTLIWILACYSRPSGWHYLWPQLMKDPLDELSLPALKGPALELYGHLHRRRHGADDARSFQVNRWRFWKAYTAILVYVKSKRLGLKFRGCPTCHALYLRAFPNSPRDNWEDSGAGVEHPGSAEQTLLPPASADSGHDDTRLPEESSLAVSSRVGPIDFQLNILDDSLSLDERQRIFEQQLQNLADFATSHGLRLPNGLIYASSPPNSQESSGTVSANVIAPGGNLIPRQIGNTDGAARQLRNSSGTHRISNFITFYLEWWT